LYNNKQGSIMKRLAVILAGSTLAMSGYAANWLEVSKSQTGSVFSLDVDSIERSDIHIIDEKEVENITVSIRRTYPAPKDSAKDAKENEAKAKESKDKGANRTVEESSIHHSDQQWLISCKDASYDQRAYVNYAADDIVLESCHSDKPILTTRDVTLTKPKTGSRLLVHQ